MERTTGILIALSALVAISAIDIAAQDEVETRRVVRGTPGVEAIMGMREALALTEEQIADLDAIRRESVQRRNTDLAELAEVRSQFAAGQIERSEVMAFMEGRRDANQGVEERQRERLDAILTEAQVESLHEARGRTLRFAGRRDSARRGNGNRFRGARSNFRGGRGGGLYDRGGDVGLRRGRRRGRG